MKQKDMQNLLEQYYKYIGISSKKKQIKILNLLSYCKEIRDTAYPMKNSEVTELEICEFVARKEKDLIYINGTLSLNDDNQRENRHFETYIIEDKTEGKTRIYMDITRINVEDEPKMIRTSEAISVSEYKVVSVTAYCTTDSIEEKFFLQNFQLIHQMITYFKKRFNKLVLYSLKGNYSLIPFIYLCYNIKR